MKIDKAILNTEYKKSIDQNRMTEKLGIIVIEMAREWNKKTRRKKELGDDDYEECVSASIERVMIEWKFFDFERYSDGFNFLTTLIARGSLKGLNNINGTTFYLKQQKISPIFCRLEDQADL